MPLDEVPSIVIAIPGVASTTPVVLVALSASAKLVLDFVLDFFATRHEPPGF